MWTERAFLIGSAFFDCQRYTPSDWHKLEENLAAASNLAAPSGDIPVVTFTKGIPVVDSIDEICVAKHYEGQFITTRGDLFEVRPFPGQFNACWNDLFRLLSMPPGLKCDSCDCRIGSIQLDCITDRTFSKLHKSSLLYGGPGSDLKAWVLKLQQVWSENDTTGYWRRIDTVLDCQSIQDDFRQLRDYRVSVRLAVAAVPRAQLGEDITEHPYQGIAKFIRFTEISGVEYAIFVDKNWERVPDRSAAEADSDGKIDDGSAATSTDEGDDSERGSTLESTEWPYDHIRRDEASDTSGGISPWLLCHYQLEGAAEIHQLYIDRYLTLKVSDSLCLH